ncbi:hypothetical protein ABW19_dt0200695 [Dactylella cylindrospora]|nr:hypothetical protein ABW19_dt0200695 [Dactylella cylindrospora]
MPRTRKIKTSHEEGKFSKDASCRNWIKHPSEMNEASHWNLSSNLQIPTAQKKSSTNTKGGGMNQRSRYSSDLFCATVVPSGGEQYEDFGFSRVFFLNLGLLQMRGIVSCVAAQLPLVDIQSRRACNAHEFFFFFFFF